MSVFSGIKVLDIGSFVAGPMAATILSDFGADVVKIEPPEGDGYRRMHRLPNLPRCDHNYAWALASRNKRSLVLDLKKDAARAVLHRLVREADVLVINYPAEVRAQLGLTAPVLMAMNPRLIYASLSGYGETGPDAGRRGFDATAFWARSGLCDMVRTDAHAPPAAPTLGMGDQPTSVVLYAAIVTALFRRERTGLGGEVSTSLMASGIWANGPMVQAALCGGELRYREPRTAPRSALSNFYLCRDGRWFSLAMVEEEKLWPGLTRILGIEHLLTDAHFAELPQRRANAAALVAELDRVFAGDDSANWLRRFEGSAHTVGVVARTTDVIGDPQAYACGALVEADGIGGTRFTVDSPFHMAGEHKQRPACAPELGQHSDEVLREYGWDDDAIQRLRHQAALG